jgi:hypothetical protein
VDNYFSSPALFDDLYKRKTNFCGTIHHYRKNVPPSFASEDLKMKNGDILPQVWGNLRDTCWKDRLEVYVLTNIHAPPDEENFTDKCGNTMKPLVIEDYNTCMVMLFEKWSCTSVENATACCILCHVLSCCTVKQDFEHICVSKCHVCIVGSLVIVWNLLGMPLSVFISVH